MAPQMSNLLVAASKEADALKDEYTSVEHLLLAMVEVDCNAKDPLTTLGVTREAILEAMKELRGSQRVTDASPEEKYQALQRYGRDLCELASRGKREGGRPSPRAR